MWDAPEGRLPLPEADERSLGRHAVGLNGWADHGTSLIFQNSYGPDWGNNGSGVLTKEYADLYLREAWTERIGACGPNSENWEAVMTATGFDLAKAWVSSEKAVMGTMRARRQRFDYRYYPVVAFSFGCVVELSRCAAMGRISARAGRICTIFPRKASVVRCFASFSWFRKPGDLALEPRLSDLPRTCGRPRCGCASDRSQRSRCLWGVMEAARSFASRCGYEWMAGSTMHPSIHSYAQKNLRAPDSIGWWLSG